MDIDIKWGIEDNSDRIKGMSRDAVEKTLIEMGEQWLSHAVAQAPVDTGRYRNSLSYSTATMDSGGADSVSYASEGELIVGSDVEYAAALELGIPGTDRKAHHTVGNAIKKQASAFKAILENNLKSG